MADQVGRLLDPYQTTPLFVCLPSSDAPTLALLPLAHHRQRVHLLAWYDSPGEARTGPIFERSKIVNFVVSAYRHNQRLHRSIKIRSNDTQINMKRLLELIYMGVRLGGMFSLVPMAASLISAVLRHLCVCLFDVPLLLILPPPAFALQGGALLAARHIAATAVQLVPIVVVLATVINAPLPLPPPGALAVATLPIPGRIVNIVATRGLVPSPPRERAMWAWVMGKEGGNVRPHRLLLQRYPYRGAPLASPCLSLPGHPKGVIVPHCRRN
jgi:hypothetical protein